ncbi:MAG: hypothetical protein KDJ52_36840, partial [Anaerolineae bacterium]|nr:hypothetical protein [Anaerolineae bacterium]
LALVGVVVVSVVVVRGRNVATGATGAWGENRTSKDSGNSTPSQPPPARGRSKNILISEHVTPPAVEEARVNPDVVFASEDSRDFSSQARRNDMEESQLRIMNYELGIKNDKASLFIIHYSFSNLRFFLFTIATLIALAIIIPLFSPLLTLQSDPDGPQPAENQVRVDFGDQMRL